MPESLSHSLSSGYNVHQHFHQLSSQSWRWLWRAVSALLQPSPAASGLPAAADELSPISTEKGEQPVDSVLPEQTPLMSQQGGQTTADSSCPSAPFEPAELVLLQPWLIAPMLLLVGLVLGALGCTVWQESPTRALLLRCQEPLPQALDDEPQLLTSSEVTAAVAWRRPLRRPAPALHFRRQQHTPVCINFNTAPWPDSLATVLKVQSALHRHLTIVAPVPLHELPAALPAGLHYIHCVQGSVLAEDSGRPPEVAEGYNGAVQHVCAAACFDYYAARLPHIRGVLWQSDDMFVNYTQLFHSFPHSKSWSPSDGRLFSLTNATIFRLHDWTRFPIANLFSLRHTAELLQSDARYRKAWWLAHGSLTMASEKVNSDFFYVPYHQLQTFVGITRFLVNSPTEFVSVPDTSAMVVDANAAPRTISVRVGVTMSEWWTATQLRLTAAIHLLQSKVNASTAELSDQLLHMSRSQVFLWFRARRNITRLKELCFHLDYDITPPAVIHPLKLTDTDQRQLYLEAYQRVRESM